MTIGDAVAVDASGPMVILGSQGMLGRAWTQLAQQRGLAHHAWTRAEADLSKPGETARAIRQLAGSKPAVVVNCAAWTDVDGAEEHEARATRVNGHAVAELAEACAAVDALLVNYSTDYVFDGQADAPYAVDHPRDPLNAYGRSKAIGESFLEAAHGRWLNVRTSWLYAGWGRNFVLTMAKLTRDKPELKVVDDQLGRPTSAAGLAERTLGLIEAGAQGHAHLCDGGWCTWRGLAEAVGQGLGHDCVVAPCTTADFPRPAKRPAYSVLDLSASEAVLGPIPDWRDALADVLQTLGE
ncbi:MAG: dTDP-4-dehydrorhamnose reductase [Planctomycetota bacterium]